MVLKPVFVGSNQNEGSLFLIILGIKVPLDTPIFGLLSTSTFTCPSDVAAKARVANNIKTWRYYYAGVFPNQNIGPEYVIMNERTLVSMANLTSQGGSISWFGDTVSLRLHSVPANLL